MRYSNGSGQEGWIVALGGANATAFLWIRVWIIDKLMECMWLSVTQSEIVVFDSPFFLNLKTGIRRQ